MNNSKCHGKREINSRQKKKVRGNKENCSLQKKKGGYSKKKKTQGKR